MNISQLKQSKFLTRGDVGRGMLVTIREIFQDNVAKEGAPEELRWCLSFDEAEKPMVLNSTNGQIIAGITESDETDSWIGHKIVLYDDPNVSFGGKLVGGIRVRAPRLAPSAVKTLEKPVSAPTHGILGKPRQPSPPAELPPGVGAESDDVPF